MSIESRGGEKVIYSSIKLSHIMRIILHVCEMYNCAYLCSNLHLSVQLNNLSCVCVHCVVIPLSRGKNMNELNKKKIESKKLRR